MSGTGKTPGQRAYEAWWANRPPVTGTAIAIPADWNGERPETHAQWEAAAKAAAPGFSMLVDEARAELADLRKRAEWYESERIRLRELLNEASIAEPVTAGTEHVARQLLDPGDPGAWQRVADMPARER